MAVGELTNRGTKTDAAMDHTTTRLQAMTLPDENVPAQNPDKPVSGVEEEPGKLAPGDPKDKTAVSGEKSKSSTPVKSAQKSAKTASPANVTPTKTAEKGKSPSQAPRSSNKPSAISTGQTPIASTSTPKTPSSASRPTTSGTQSSSTPSKMSGSPRNHQRRASRSSLTASTASSAAKVKPHVSEAAPAQPTRYVPGTMTSWRPSAVLVL